MTSRSAIGEARLTRLRSVLCFVVAFHVCSLAPTNRSEVRADPFAHGIVTTGAFLVNSHGKRAGYLPVGTIVDIIGQDRTVRNKRTGKRETYSAVISQSGLQGYLRTDLRVLIGEHPILVPIDTRDKIPLYRQPLPNQDNVDCDHNSDVCIYFARDNDVYLEVVGTDDQGYYETVLHRNSPDPARGLLPEEPGWVERWRVESGEMKKVDELSASSAVARWQQTDYADEQELPIKGSIREDYGNDDWRLLCKLSVTAEADAGVKIFGIGVAVGADAQLKKEGMMRLKERYQLQRDQTAENYRLFRDIKCDDLDDPERMYKLTMEKDDDDGTFGKKEVFFTDMEQVSCASDSDGGRCSKWLRVVDSKRTFNRMVLVDGWDSYNHLYQQLKHSFEGGEGEIFFEEQATEDEKQREINEQYVLYNFILRQIAVFAEPPDSSS